MKTEKKNLEKTALEEREHQIFYYPNDRIPKEEELEKDLNQMDFLKIGPKFTAYHYAHKLKIRNGVIDLGLVEGRLLDIFCLKNINDEQMSYLGKIASEAWFYWMKR